MPSPTLEAAIGGEIAETTSTTPDAVHDLVKRARAAQAAFEAFSQAQVDAIVRDLGKYVYDNAEAVAAMAHKETGLDRRVSPTGPNCTARSRGRSPSGTRKGRRRRSPALFAFLDRLTRDALARRPLV